MMVIGLLTFTTYRSSHKDTIKLQLLPGRLRGISQYFFEPLNVSREVGEESNDRWRGEKVVDFSVLQISPALK